MAYAQFEVAAIGATQFFVGTPGASVFPLLIKPDVSSFGGNIKCLNGSTAVLNILPRAVAGASVGGATNAINGYPLGATEIFAFSGPAAFYIQATGFTATVAMTWLYTAGATLA